MSDFKVGDRVEYTGNIAAHLTGKRGVVIEHEFSSHNMTYVQFDSGKPWGCMNGSIQLANPDPIIINRADLPEVTASKDHLLAGKNTFGRFLDADGHRKMALSQLAVAEYMEAEERSKTALDKRRDELAERVSGVIGTRYSLRNRDLRNAIDYAIELEDAAK